MTSQPRPVHPTFFVAASGCLVAGLTFGVFIGNILPIHALIRGRAEYPVPTNIAILAVTCLLVAVTLVSCGIGMLFRSRVAAVVGLVVTSLAMWAYVGTFLVAYMGVVPLMGGIVVVILLGAGLAWSAPETDGRPDPPR
jgi:hypothetical protein